MSVSHDDRFLISASWDYTVRIWDLTSTPISTSPVALTGHKDGISVIALTPDDSWLATGSWDSQIKLWPLDINYLIEAGCEAAGRNLYEDEWEEYFGAQSYRKICDNK